MAKLNRKPDRRRARTNEPDAQEVSRYRTSWRSAFLAAALAAIASAVVLVWLYNPLSMLGAATRTEYLTLAQQSDPKAGQVRLGGPGWDDLIAAANAEYRVSPARASQAVVRRLLSLVREAHLGYRTAPDALAEAQAESARDGDNLVVRLALAVLVDLSNAPEGSSGDVPGAALGRYEAVRATVEGAGSTATATLHNGELTGTWYRVVQRFVRRPQAAASLAASFPHDCTESQYEVLPIVQERLAGLAEDLRAAGRPDEARRCIHWLAELAIGLMKADKDAGTRLLCADLLARSLRDQPTLAEPLVRMRLDFHSAATAAPIDVCDQSFTQTPTVAPSQYRWAFYSLVIVGALATLGAGSAVVFLISCVAACLARVFCRSAEEPRASLKEPRTSVRAVAPKADREPTCEPSAVVEIKRGWIVRMIFSLAPSLALGALLIGWFEAYGLFSELWGYVAVASLAAAGATWAAVSAAWMTDRRTRFSRRRQWATVAIGVLVALPLLLPPPATARLAREIDLRVSIGWVLLSASCLTTAAALFCSPSRWRTLAVAAAMGWCVNVVTATAILPFHQVADHYYQKAVVSKRFDEISARLGADWEDRYLKPVKEAFALDGP